jgi:hypothetical protein
VDDESRDLENMANVLCAVALGMVPLTLTIDDQMEQLFAGIRCLCFCNGEARLDGEGVATLRVVTCSSCSREKAFLLFLFLIDHHLSKPKPRRCAVLRCTVLCKIGQYRGCSSYYFVRKICRGSVL